jgi:hypothetical protein
MFKFLGVAVMAMLLAGCASEAASPYTGANGKTLIVEPNVWSNYEDYLTHVSSTNPGIFIVVIDDDHAVSSGYSVCPEGHCIADTSTNAIMNECKSNGLTCAIFAHSSSIVLNYKLDGQSS